LALERADVDVADPPQAALVGGRDGDARDRRGAGVDGRAAGQEGEGLGGPAVVSQGCEAGIAHPDLVAVGVRQAAAAARADEVVRAGGVERADHVSWYAARGAVIVACDDRVVKLNRARGVVDAAAGVTRGPVCGEGV